MGDTSSQSEIVLGTLGAIELGILFSSVLYGVTCVQAYNYAMHTVGDRTWIRVLVAVVIFLETLELIFGWAYFFNVSVTHYGNLSAMANVPWQYNAMLASHATCACVVQLFLTWRVYRVTGKLWLALPAAVGAVMRLVFTWLISILEPIEGLAAFKAKQEWMFYLSLSLSTAVDIWVTFSLSYHLWSRRTPYKDTRDKISGIITWTVETGLVICVTSVFVMVTWAVWPLTLTWMAIVLVYGRMYSISLLVSLNARDSRSKWGSHQTELGPTETSVSITRSYQVEMSDMSGARRNIVPLNMSKAEQAFEPYAK